MKTTHTTEYKEKDMARLATGSVPGPWEDWSNGMAVQSEAMKRLQDHANSLPDGEVVGALIKFQVADGYAIYRVEKAKPLTLAHVPFCDGYRIADAHIRGLNLADVKALVAGERRMASLFGRGKF